MIKTKFIFPVLLALLSSIYAKGENYGIFVAGSDNTIAQANTFAKNLQAMSNALKERGGWTVNLPEATYAINSQRKNEISQWDLGGISATLQNAKKHDQVLLVYNGHGLKPLEADTVANEKSHSIVTPNGYISWDSIVPSVEKATKRGVRVAIVDLSCFSGNTQEIAKQSGACIITTAPKNFYGYFSVDDKLNNINTQSDGFMALFTHGIAGLEKKELSLEDYFLSVREKDIKMLNYPQISSLKSPGAAGWDQLFAEVDPYNSNRKKSDAWKIGNDNSPFQSDCPKLDAFSKIQKQVDVALTAIDQTNTKDIKQIKTNFQLLIENYRKTFDDLEKIRMKLNIESNFNDFQTEVDYSTRENLRNNPNLTSNRSNETIQNAISRTDLYRSLDLLQKKQDNLTIKILEQERYIYNLVNSERKNYKNKWKNLWNNIGQQHLSSENQCDGFKL